MTDKLASMRPRHKAAEIADHGGGLPAHCVCFNEAAAQSRGNHTRPWKTLEREAVLQ